MTRPSKQVRARERWRRQAARLVGAARVAAGAMAICIRCGGVGALRDGPAVVGNDATRECDDCEGSGLGSVRWANRILAGLESFDVALVRSYCEQLIADGERRAVEREVFADWTRALGVGPENRERGAFGSGRVECGSCGGWGLVNGYGNDVQDCPAQCYRGTERGPIVGGWPGPLAREWATVECEACQGRGRVESDRFDCDCEGTGEIVNIFGEKVGCVACDGDGAIVEHERCEPCRGRGRLPRHGRRRDAAAGPGLARAAQRLLDTLDGRCPWAPSAGAQPSDCQACDGDGGHDDHGPGGEQSDQWFKCDACRGTGHNLAGVLPLIEDSEATIVAVADALESLLHSEVVVVEDLDEDATRLAEWQRDVVTRNRARVEALYGDRTGLGPQSRVLPRGQHRSGDDPNEPPGAITGCRANVASDGYEVGDMIRVHGYGVGRWAPRSTIPDRRARASQAGGKGSPESLMPRWRRGELRPADRRRWRPMLATGGVLDRIGLEAGFMRGPNESDANYRERILASHRSIAVGMPAAPLRMASRISGRTLLALDDGEESGDPRDR